MSQPEPLTTYLELRESTAEGDEGAGLSHKAGGLVLLHVLEIAAHGEPRGGVTILHDAGDHGGRYVEVANALARAHWAVALPDMRGHGKSEGLRGHSAGAKEIVRDIDAVQQHLSYRLPIAPKALIGQGLGALYALHYALEKPGQVAALVLLAPRWNVNFEMPQPGGLFKRFKKPDPTSAGKVGIIPDQLTSDAAQQLAWKGDSLVHDTITLRAAAEAAEIAANCASRIRSLNLPILIFNGAADRIADHNISKSLASKSIQVDVLAGLKHDLLHESGADEISARIADWLVANVR